MSARSTSDFLFAEAVTYFPLVGAVPLLGRLLQPASDDLSAAPVVVISERYWRRRFDVDAEIVRSVVVQVSAALTGILGLVALVLAMTGLYGVMSYIVAGRRREIGVRRALGATNTLVRWMILRDGLRPILSGLLAGLALGGAVRFAAGRLLPGLPEVDAWLAVTVPLLFIAAGMVACYIPARRACEVDPSVALRDS